MTLLDVRDPRLFTIRRGGLLSDANHQLLALWAAQCAEHVLHLSARFAACAAGRAACVGHLPEHDLGAAAYAIKAVQVASPSNSNAGRLERDWQRDHIHEQIRALVLEDQVR